MVAEKVASREEGDDSGAGQSGENLERGYYGRALREGQVRPPPSKAARRVDTLLWVFNVVLWLVLGGFVAWRLYATYLAGGA